MRCLPCHSVSPSSANQCSTADTLPQMNMKARTRINLRMAGRTYFAPAVLPDQSGPAQSIVAAVTPQAGKGWKVALGCGLGGNSLLTFRPLNKSWWGFPEGATRCFGCASTTSPLRAYQNDWEASSWRSSIERRRLGEHSYRRLRRYPTDATWYDSNTGRWVSRDPGRPSRIPSDITRKCIYSNTFICLPGVLSSDIRLHLYPAGCECWIRPVSLAEARSSSAQCRSPTRGASATMKLAAQAPPGISRHNAARLMSLLCGNHLVTDRRC